MIITFAHDHFSHAEKIVEIDSHIACAFSGLTADSKTLIDRFQIVNFLCKVSDARYVNYILHRRLPGFNTSSFRARVESQNHWFTYDEKMQVLRCSIVSII